MHELGLIYQVVKTVDEVVAQQGLTEVAEIVLDVGEMMDAVPVYLEQAWQSARLSTDYPNAKMTVNVVSARAKCADCGFEDLIKNIDFECPNCHSMNLKIVSGREFEIKHIVAR